MVHVLEKHQGAHNRTGHDAYLNRYQSNDSTIIPLKNWVDDTCLPKSKESDLVGQAKLMLHDS